MTALAYRRITTVRVPAPSAYARSVVGGVLAQYLRADHERRVLQAPGVRDAFDEALSELRSLR